MTGEGYRGGNTLVPRFVRGVIALTIAPEVGPMDATTPGPLVPEVLDREDLRRAWRNTTSQPPSR